MQVAAAVVSLQPFGMTKIPTRKIGAWGTLITIRSGALQQWYPLTDGRGQEQTTQHPGHPPGEIEYENPFDNNGKLRPGYSCFPVSKDKCYEKCVNDIGNAARKNPPCHKMGSYQCDTRVADTEHQCLTKCSKK
jgi:hypothetical protein